MDTDTRRIQLHEQIFYRKSAVLYHILQSEYLY